MLAIWDHKVIKMRERNGHRGNHLSRLRRPERIFRGHRALILVEKVVGEILF